MTDKDPVDNARAKKRHDMSQPKKLIIPHQPDARPHTALLIFRDGDEENPVFPKNYEEVFSHLLHACISGHIIDNQSNSPMLSAAVGDAMQLVSTPALECGYISDSPTPHDPVNQPQHYKLPGLGVEWIDVRSALLKTIPAGVPYEVVTSWNEAITYLARMWGKNGLEDLKKAQFYINRAINLMETPE